MQVTRKQKLVAAGVAAVAVAGGGAAVAASKFGSPSEESTAVVKDAANRLGVQPSALSDALSAGSSGSELMKSGSDSSEASCSLNEGGCGPVAMLLLCANFSGKGCKKQTDF